MRLVRQAEPGIMLDTIKMSDKAKLVEAWSDKTHKSGNALDGGVAQLVRAAES